MPHTNTSISYLSQVAGYFLREDGSGEILNKDHLDVDDVRRLSHQRENCLDLSHGEVVYGTKQCCGSVNISYGSGSYRDIFVTIGKNMLSNSPIAPINIIKY